MDSPRRDPQLPSLLLSSARSLSNAGAAMATKGFSDCILPLPIGPEKPPRVGPSSDGPRVRERPPHLVVAAPEPLKAPQEAASPAHDEPECNAPPPPPTSGLCVRRGLCLSLGEDASPPASPAESPTGPPRPTRRRQWRLPSLEVETPPAPGDDSDFVVTPGSPEPPRESFRPLGGRVRVVFFDFDGTLTATPGEAGTRRLRKKRELERRAPMLGPPLRGLRDAGILLGIVSKSTEQTIREALDGAGLADLFEGPVIGKALGLEGKAGLIADMHEAGRLDSCTEGLARILLVDDDIHELARSRERGIQTFAAPREGGLQEADFREIFAYLSLPSPSGRSVGLGELDIGGLGG